MSYKNKTYVAFASEDIDNYWLMQAWKANENIDFDFFNAHELYKARDTSKPETIKRNLRERMKNAKQVVFLGTTTGKRKGGDGNSFLAYEVDIMMEFNLPVVVANLGGSRDVERKFIPSPLLDDDYYTESVSFQPKIIKHALDDYAVRFASSDKTGPYHYNASVYADLGL